MLILGQSDREYLPMHEVPQGDLVNPQIEQIQKIIGTDPASGNPINDLNFVQDSRFVDYFQRPNPNQVPNCRDISVLKPTSVETFAENQKFNEYLVDTIEDSTSSAEELKKQEISKYLNKENDNLENSENG